MNYTSPKTHTTTNTEQPKRLKLTLSGHTAPVRALAISPSSQNTNQDCEIDSEPLKIVGMAITINIIKLATQNNTTTPKPTNVK